MSNKDEFVESFDTSGAGSGTCRISWILLFIAEFWACLTSHAFNLITVSKKLSNFDE